MSMLKRNCEKLAVHAWRLFELWLTSVKQLITIILYYWCAIPALLTNAVSEYENSIKLFFVRFFIRYRSVGSFSVQIM